MKTTHLAVVLTNIAHQCQIKSEYNRFTALNPNWFFASYKVKSYQGLPLITKNSPKRYKRAPGSGQWWEEESMTVSAHSISNIRDLYLSDLYSLLLRHLCISKVGLSWWTPSRWWLGCYWRLGVASVGARIRGWTDQVLKPSWTLTQYN